MEMAIRKFMQMTFNVVSNPIFDGFHLITSHSHYKIHRSFLLQVQSTD
jgi:hypothetical protein